MAFRKAVGAVKDQTSIGIVKLTGQLTPTLKIAIVKATSHDDDPASDKYVRQILSLTSHSTLHIHACLRTLSKRLAKTRDWIVALKVLVLVNRLLNEGDPEFFNELAYAARLLNLSEFRSSGSWDHSAFVRALGLYLHQKVEFIKHSWCQEDQQKRPRPYRSVSDNYGGYRERRPERSHSYGDIDIDIDRRPPAQTRTQVPLTKMGIEGVLGRMDQVHRLLDRFLACRPTGTAKNCRMVMFALYPIVQESFKVYGDVCEVLSALLDRFFDIEYADCLKVFEAYCVAAKQIDELVGFYNWCKACGVVRSAEFPEVQRVTEKVLGTLEEFIRDKEKKPKSDETPTPVTAVEIAPEMKTNEIKSSPTLEPDPQPKPEVRTVPEPVVPLKDLVDLTEETISSEEQSDRLALALFSAPQTSSQGALSGVTSAWQNPAAEIGKADWELALVESASHLSSQAGSLPGGFDPVMLNSMYDAGLVKQYTSTAEFSSGSASSVAGTAGLGKGGKAMLALPGPDGSVESVGRDPFAASVNVPPPAYVQMADMEKKQQMLVQEQMVWNQYAREGMQGQVGLGKISGSGFYNAGSMGMVPYGMQPVNGVGSGGGYYYQPY